eukprot:7706662-Pyramimonas_sp.AAC.2
MGPRALLSPCLAAPPLENSILPPIILTDDFDDAAVKPLLSHSTAGEFDPPPKYLYLRGPHHPHHRPRQ